MAGDARLRDKLRKIEALFAGAGTEGERLAAEAALARIRARLADIGRSEAPVEIQFSLPDTWSRQLFLALCRRYGTRALSLSAPAPLDRRAARARRFVDDVLLARVQGARRRSALLPRRGDAAPDPRGGLLPTPATRLKWRRRRCRSAEPLTLPGQGPDFAWLDAASRRR